jgi:hypothetical protein
VRLGDGATGRLRALKANSIGPVSFGLDDRPLQFAHWDKAVFALLNPEYDEENERLLQRFSVPPELLELNGQDSRVVSMPDGSYVAIAVLRGQQRGRTAVWNGRSGKLLGIIECEARAIEFAPDGTWLALGDDTGKLRRFSLPSLAELDGWDCGPGAIEYLAIGRNPHVGDEANAAAPTWLIATPTQGGNLVVWDARTANDWR